MREPRPTRRLFCALLGAALFPVAGCARRWPPPVPPTPSAPEIVATPRGIFGGLGGGYVFEIELQNPAAAPRWLVFPTDISLSPTLDMSMASRLGSAVAI